MFYSPYVCTVACALYGVYVFTGTASALLPAPCALNVHGIPRAWYIPCQMAIIYGYCIWILYMYIDMFMDTDLGRERYISRVRRYISISTD